MYHYAATIERVIDGDTVDLSIDLGFSVWIRQRVRLAGIDAPERYTDAGRAAKAYLAALLPEGLKVQTQTMKAESTEKYGRYLADVLIGVGGQERSVATIMVCAGHAEPYDGGKRL